MTSAWREEMQPRIVALGIPLDFTPDSLARLEELVAALPHLSLAAAGYLGEALMRVGGGHWEMTDAGPLVHFDPALELAPLAVLELVGRAVDAHDEITRTVAFFKERNPKWSPTKEHTPAVDWIDDSDHPQHPWLVSWLAARAESFPQWTVDHPGPWDFTPESLDSLEKLVQTLGLESEEFVEGAVWYLGEVAVRHRGARWKYYYDERPYSETGSVWDNNPFVSQSDPDGHATVPIFMLKTAVRLGEPGILRDRFARFR
ncbi:MAG: hypothetical protein QOF58_8597 [Pseudonocardiales bacterium]|jgi:hypothetical protein|nr:hypothetical protein [Pseudonocardiales bacterium]